MNSLILRNSNRPLSVLDQMDRILDSFFTDSTGSLHSASRHPAVDVRGDEKEYVMTVDIPGLSEKDVEIKLDDNLLTISRKAEETREESEATWYMRERRTLDFARSFTIPKDVDREAIGARAENGVLTITLPKSEKAKPRMIDIRRG